MARVIALGSKKGGVGKSMCISNLAVMASLMGAGVKIIDSDKQGSSIKFIHRRSRWDGLSPITCSHAQGISMLREIEAANQVYDVVLVDLAGTDNSELREIMLSPFVGELYTPLQPSGEDLETLTELEALVHIAKQSKPDFKLYTLLNRLHVNPKVVESKSAISFLSSRQLSEFTGVTLVDRPQFRRARDSGLCVYEYEQQYRKKQAHKASLEISKLFTHAFGFEFNLKQTKLKKEDKVAGELEHV